MCEKIVYVTFVSIDIRARPETIPRTAKGEMTLSDPIK